MSSWPELRRQRWLNGLAAGAVAFFFVAQESSGARGPSSLPVTRAEKLASALKPAGRPRLVHVWATWCVPCVVEWPRLAELLREWKGKPLDVVTVALDEPSRGEAAARILDEAGGVPGEALLSPPSEAFAAVRAIDPDWDGAVPTTYLLTADGKLAHAQRGSTRLRLLRAEIERITQPRASGAGEITNERRRS